MSLPAIISNTQIRPFRYCHGSSLYQGMMFQGNLYKLLRTYHHHSRSQVFERACELSNQGDVVISTDNSQVYSLWVDVCLDISVEPVAELGTIPTAA